MVAAGHSLLDAAGRGATVRRFYRVLLQPQKSGSLPASEQTAGLPLRIAEGMDML